MADFRYFADIEGVAHQLEGILHEGPGIRAKHFSGHVPSGERVRATRRIEYKPSPSRHQCDARCQNATGRIMKCECSCGGRNHGKGSA